MASQALRGLSRKKGRASMPRFVQVERTSFRSPLQNSVAEHRVGNCLRTVIDHVMVLNERDLNRSMNEYVGYYRHLHTTRAHRQRFPATGTGSSESCSTQSMSSTALRASTDRKPTERRSASSTPCASGPTAELTRTQ